MPYNPEIFFISLVVWSVSISVINYRAGYNRRKKEEITEEIVASLESTENVNSRPQADSDYSKTSQVVTSACHPWTKPADSLEE